MFISSVKEVCVLAKMGRPKKEETRSNAVMVRFTDKEYQKLKKHAEDTELTIAEIVRYGVNDIIGSAT
jgi:hypothetical protein